MVRPRNVGRVKAKGPTPDWEQEEFESRTQIKHAAQAVTDLGEKLAALTETEIKKLALPQAVQDAVLMLKKMDKGPALKRQKLFLGKVLRKDEPLLIEIKEKLEAIQVKAKQQNAHFHRLEQWRDRLLSEGDEALNAFMQEYTHADRSQLRQWIRNAQKEAQLNKPPKAARAIFKYLKALEW